MASSGGCVVRLRYGVANYQPQALRVASDESWSRIFCELFRAHKYRRAVTAGGLQFRQPAPWLRRKIHAKVGDW